MMGQWEFWQLEIDGYEGSRFNGELLVDFGEDLSGELYVMTHETRQSSEPLGRVYKIVPVSSAGDL